LRPIWFTDAYSNRNCNTYADADVYTKAFAYAAEQPDTAGASDFSASPVADRRFFLSRSVRSDFVSCRRVAHSGFTDYPFTARLNRAIFC